MHFKKCELGPSHRGRDRLSPVKTVLNHICVIPRTSLVAQMVKRLPIMCETRISSLGCKDSLEKEMATHSSILTWRTPWTKEPGRLQSIGSQRVGHDWATSFYVVPKPSLNLSSFGWILIPKVIPGKQNLKWMLL